MEDKNVIEVKPSYASEVQRALVTLGFSESERSRAIDLNSVPQALKTFSSWIDRLQSLPVADEELCATWSEYMRARFGGGEPPMTPTAVNEAAHAAHYAITMQLQLFPPRSRAASSAGNSYAEEWTELSAWREAGLACQIDSPKELAETAGMNFGQFVDRKVTREWQDETGEQSPKLAGQRIGSLVNDVHGQSQRIQALLDERELWREKTNCEHPKEFASEWSEVEFWKTETGCLTATGAGELIKGLCKEDNSLQIAKSQLAHWESCTGCATPHEARETINALRAKLRERDQDLLTANAEIDRVKKAAQTLGHEIGIVLIPSTIKDVVSELARVQNENLALRKEIIGAVLSAHPDCVRLTAELAKVRAELQTKCREAQTEKERAERAESASNARGVLLEKIGEALRPNTPVLWDPLPGQVAYVVEQREFEKMRADDEFRRRVDAESYLHKIDEAQFEFTRIRPGYARLAEELTSSWKQASLQCATLSDPLRKEQQHASTAESMLRVEQQKHEDTKKELLAANRFANEHSIMWERMSAAIGLRKDSMVDIVQWIEDTQKRLASAIIPLPKPERVEPGQKWAFIGTCHHSNNDGAWFHREEHPGTGSVIFERQDQISERSMVFLGS